MLEKSELYKEWILESGIQAEKIDYRDSLREKYKEYKVIYWNRLYRWIQKEKIKNGKEN